MQIDYNPVMNLNDAISTLSKLKQDKVKSQADSETNTVAKGLNTFKNIIVTAMVDLTKLVLSNEPRVTVKNFPKSTTINNKELPVKVLNFPKDTTAEEVRKLTDMMDKHHMEMKEEKENKKREKPDDSKQKLLSTGESILATQKSSFLGQMVRLTSLQDTLNDTLKAIKGIKLDPKITVKAPEVKVDAPIINIPKTEPVKFPKSFEVSNLDLTETVNKLEEIVTELQYNSNKPIVVANPGDFPVSTTNTRELATHTKQDELLTELQKKADLTETQPVDIINLPPANQSAFGTLETAELTPVIQGDWVYGINTQLWSTPVTSGTGATVDTNNSRLRIQSGTNSAGYAYITSRRPVRYRAGEGTLFRLTPIFTTGVANSIQLWGMGTITSNTPYDGYFFGYNGTSFGICHYNRGTPTWTPEASWNGTAITWDKTKGTPIMVKYPYLGYGDIMFYVQHATTGSWVLVHTIRYANTTATTQLSNPTLNIIGFVLNSGNTTNLTLYSGSVGAFISGQRSFISNPKWAIDNVKTTVTTETNIISLKNATTYNTVTNRGLVRLNSFSVGADAGKNVVANATIRFKIGATIGGSPAFTTINGTTADNGVTITTGNSIVSYDVAGTTVTNGTMIFNISLSEPSSQIIDLTPFEIFISPGEVLTISGYSSASATINCSINWSEDI